ncbi:MAG: phosphatidylinositol mannoside acyltransferase [Actinomycetota bacterium]
MSSKGRAARDGFPDEGRLIQLVYYLYRGGSALAQALPEGLAYAMANLLGTVQMYLSPRKRAIVGRNLARVTGELPGSPRLEKLVGDAYRSYARYWLETFRLARASPGFFLERFTCHHIERLDEARARGGAVIVVGHLGNWDAAGAWVAASGRPAITIAEVLRPRRLFEFFCEHRARLGMTIYPALPGVTTKLVEDVKQGRLVAILGDRDLSGRGIEVDFFGARSTLPVGPASVALRAGVPLLVVGVYGVRRPDGTRGWEAEVGEAIELPSERGPPALGELTQKIASEFERYVARRPEEWHVFQPVWLEDRRSS